MRTDIPFSFTANGPQIIRLTRRRAAPPCGVNESTFAGDLHAGENAVLVNGGDMEIGPLQLLDTVFVNLGRFATADSANGYYQDFIDGFGVNLGDIAVRASHNFTLEGGVQWWNAGSITVEENAAMRNFSTVENDGTISVSSVPKEGAVV